MRYKHLLSEQQLDELRMSPSSLRNFAKSREAQGIQAGFEAELVFRGLGDPDDDGGSEPNYDMDERTASIDDIINFFSNDDDGFGLSDREARDLYNQLDEEWMEYFDDAMYEEWHGQARDLIRDVIENTDWDEDEQIREYLSVEHPDVDSGYVIDVGSGNITNTDGSEEENQKFANAERLYKEARNAIADELEARAEQSLADQDRYYDEALDEFRDGFSGGEQEDWLRDRYRYMSDVADAFNVTWPYWTSNREEGGYSEDAAEGLARELSSVTGMRVVASGGYHSTRRSADTWIIEPDSSLDADDSDDMPAEIVSPPMPLDQCLVMMDKFFAWAESNDAYANRSTGFHMGVSLPTTGGKVDYIKLALFLGDEHVLQEFGRQANHFTEAAMKKIRNKLKQDSSQVGDAMKLMRNGLIELATRTMSKIAGSEKSPGFGKYTSINPKGNYIEFRSAGGTNYFEDIAKLKNTLLRYAQAMTVAANPAAERKEYYKKLYKLISPPEGNAAMDLFARFASGNISAEDLKKQWAEATLEKEAPALSTPSNWQVYDKTTGEKLPGYLYHGYTEQEALARVKERMSPGSSMLGFRQMFKDKYELRNISASTGKWAIINNNTGETLEVVDSETRGPVSDLASEKYAQQGIDYYIEPVPADTPAPKLSRRAELARRIKEPKDKTPAANTYADDAVERERMRQERERIAQQSTSGINTTAGADVQWRVTNTQTGDSSIINAPSRLRANAIVMDMARRMGADEVDFDIEPYSATNQQPTVGATMADQEQIVRAAHAAATPAQQATSDNGVPMWEIYARSSNGRVTTFPDHTQTSAWSTAQQWLRDQGLPESTWNQYSVRPLMRQQPAAGSTQDIQQQRAQGEFTGAWKVVNSITGEELHRFSGVGNIQADANRVASQWLQTAGLTEPVEVVPVMAESLKLTKNVLSELDNWLGTMKLPRGFAK